MISLINNVSLAIIVIGGVIALISFGAGALLISSSGGHADRAAKGMKMIKNTIVGCGMLAMGAFLRVVDGAILKSAEPTSSGKISRKATQPAPVKHAQPHTVVHHHPVHVPWLWIGVAIAALAGATLLGKVARALYRARLRRLEQHEARAAWAKMIGEPGEDGPVEPEEGYEIIAAEKHEHLDEKMKQVIVNFHAGRYRFENRHWHRIGLADKAVSYDGPRSFNLDDDAALASAWFDYSQSCAEINRTAWTKREDQETSEVAEAQVEREELHDEAVELMSQRAALQALPGPTFTSDAVDHVLAEAKLKPRSEAGSRS